MIEKKRIGNLEFAPASYLLPKNEWPKNPSWHIDYWYPNVYYGRESEYEKAGDWYIDPKFSFGRIHKSCFKHPESCFAIASFNYDEHENFYEVRFISDRPITSLSSEEQITFWELLKYGNEQLNKHNNEED